MVLWAESCGSVSRAVESRAVEYWAVESCGRCLAGGGVVGGVVARGGGGTPPPYIVWINSSVLDVINSSALDVINSSVLDVVNSSVLDEVSSVFPFFEPDCQELAQALVAVHHIGENDVEDCELVDEIEPRLAYEQCYEQPYGAPVESQDIGIFHQRQRKPAEFLTEFHRDLAVGIPSG